MDFTGAAMNASGVNIHPPWEQGKMSEQEAVAVAEPLPGSPEWLAARRDGLGASEVPAILGLDRYKSGLDIWLEKRGLAEPRQGDTMPQKVGRFAEAMIANLYAEQTGAVLMTVPTRRHPQVETLFASADRMVVGMDAADWLYPVEIKNRGGIPQGWGEAGTDLVPEAIAVQVHVQMACYGMAFADVAALLGGNDFRVYRLYRDKDIEATILETAASWWQRHIVEGIEPEITGPSAADYLARKFREVTGDVIKADADAELLLAEYGGTRAKLAVLEEAEKELKLQVQALIGENKGIESRFGKALWSPTKGRTTTDWKGIAAELGAPPELVAKFTTTGPESRTFRWTPAKESN